jgi:hypothetical protein
MDQVKTRARGVIVDQIDRRTTDAGTMLQSHVSNLRQMGETMRSQGLGATAGVVDYAANRLEVVSTYLTETDGDRMIHDVEIVAREHAMVTGALGFLVGLTAARLLKASASDRYRTYSAGVTYTSSSPYGT